MITSPYLAPERWLHWIALQPQSARRLSFDLERLLYLPKDAQRAAQGAVYVCGLARSGTTILLRILNEIAELKSLTYRAMPFALAPNLWTAMQGGLQRNVAQTIRAHQDGILVDLDSPESLEQVFWRTFDNSVANFATRTMDSKTPSHATLAAFADYRALVANPKGSETEQDTRPRRYLSKNNNNLMRLASLCADPSAHALLAYRDPVATTRSLYRQHQRFCEAQKANRFIRQYMGWLGHHEFGLDHLPFAFAKPHMTAGLQPDDPNYWLDYWCAVHQHLLLLEADNLHLVNHAALCAQPARVLGKVLETLGLKADATALAKMVRATPSTSVAAAPPQRHERRTSETQDEILARPDEFRPDLLQRAHTAYSAFCLSSGNIIFV